MTSWLDPLLMLALALNFYILSSGRLRALVLALAAEGALLSLLPLVLYPGLGWRGVILALGSAAIKGLLIPNALLYALRSLNLQREKQPLLGFMPTLLLGAIGTGLAVIFARSLPLRPGHEQTLLLPTALSCVLTGFLILTTRLLAVSQVLGYVVLENGIFTFGLLLLDVLPFLVELGVLLDLFTGVFVMGIIIHHLQRAFDSVSTEALVELKESGVRSQESGIREDVVSFLTPDS